MAQSKAKAGLPCRALDFRPFDPATFLNDERVGPQTLYLRCYLHDLGTLSTIEEPNYFDRDYLAEFLAYYGASARGYSNVCRRIHFFTLDAQHARSAVAAALAGDQRAREALQGAYVGFTVIRPTSATPFGRTVLRWYAENNPGLPRVTSCRQYTVHLAGLKLVVSGLAWQQQDSAVGACATIALWTMFHSSALDEHHVIPTTAAITQAANRRGPLGARRVFPAGHGLSLAQAAEAIRAHGLQPYVIPGELSLSDDSGFFSTARFASSLAALIRSGYPVFLACQLTKKRKDGKAEFALPDLEGGHAVCAVGFRSAQPPVVPAGQLLEEDSGIECIYVNDDNLGPNVRCAIGTRTLELDGKSYPVAAFAPKAPPSAARSIANLPDPTLGSRDFIPVAIVAAIPDEIRLTTDRMNGTAIKFGKLMAELAKLGSGGRLAGLTYATRFFWLREYLREELPSRLSGRALLKARVALSEFVRPMSLHIGVIRLALGAQPALDIILDTTDGEHASAAFAHIIYPPRGLGELIRALEPHFDLGKRVSL